MLTDTTTATQGLSLEDELAELTSQHLHRICLGACNPSTVPGTTVTLFCGVTKVVEIGQRPLDGNGPACLACDAIAEAHGHVCPRCGWHA